MNLLAELLDMPEGVGAEPSIYMNLASETVCTHSLQLKCLLVNSLQLLHWRS
jgi:hypothetical protein